MNGDCKTSQIHENSTFDREWYTHLMRKFHWDTESLTKVTSQSEVDKYFMTRELLR